MKRRSETGFVDVSCRKHSGGSREGCDWDVGRGFSRVNDVSSGEMCIRCVRWMDPKIGLLMMLVPRDVGAEGFIHTVVCV